MTTNSADPLPAASPEWAYFLGLSGTLLGCAERPSDIRADPALLDLLSGLHACHALALVSGRSIADLDRMLHPHRFPAAGQHGLERRDAGGRLHLYAHDEHVLARARARIAGIVDSIPGTLLEDKGTSIALHYRGAPAAEAAVTNLMAQVAREAGRGYCLQPGKLVLELTPVGYSKGKAVAAFLEEPPFRDRKPVFIGDDGSDEPAFETVNSLGGITIKVGPGRTAAHWRLADTAAVRAWLAAACSRVPTAA